MNKESLPTNVGSNDGLGPNALTYARTRVSLLGADEHIATITLALDALDGLPVAALVGGWTFKGFTAWAQGLEEQAAMLNAEVESSPTFDEWNALHAQIERMRAALLNCARQAERLKKPCGMDPEGYQAVRNGQYQNISTTAHVALGTILGPNVALSGVPAPMQD